MASRVWIGMGYPLEMHPITVVRLWKRLSSNHIIPQPNLPEHTKKYQKIYTSTQPPKQSLAALAQTNSAKVLVRSVSVTSWESRSHADGRHGLVGIQIPHTCRSEVKQGGAEISSWLV